MVPLVLSLVCNDPKVQTMQPSASQASAASSMSQSSYSRIPCYHSSGSAGQLGGCHELLCGSSGVGSSSRGAGDASSALSSSLESAPCDERRTGVRRPLAARASSLCVPDVDSQPQASNTKQIDWYDIDSTRIDCNHCAIA